MDTCSLHYESHARTYQHEHIILNLDKHLISCIEHLSLNGVYSLAFAHAWRDPSQAADRFFREDQVGCGRCARSILPFFSRCSLT